jgi:soluble lytic murein transglycosylase
MKKFRFLLPLIFNICAMATAVVAQNDFAAKIRTAVENRDYAAAIAELESLRRADKKLFELNNYDYLLARAAEKRGDFALAAAQYQSVVRRNSILGEYALRHLAQIARSSGNLLLERVYLSELLAAAAPESLLIPAANARLSRSHFESGDFAAAIRLLSTSAAAAGSIQPADGRRQTTNTAPIRENQVLLGRAYLLSGKSNEAREVFTKLVTNLPNPAQPDDFALAAAKGLDELDSAKGEFGKTAPKLADLEHFRRAKIYQFNRDFRDARLHYLAIVERFPQSPNMAESLYQIGRTFAQENDFAEAVKWFERVFAEFPEDSYARDALSQMASAYSRLNKPREAISRYQRYIEKYPNEDNLERAYLNIVDVLRDTGEDTEALNWTRKTRAAFKGKLPEALAVFAEARIYIARSEWQNALNALNELQKFSDLGGTRVPGGTNKAEVSFLKAFTLENLQRYNEAIDVYLSIPDGRNEYYGWRSTERLRALRNNEKTSQFVENKFESLNTAGNALTTEERRKFAQSAYRLTNDPNFLKFTLEQLSRFYAQIPNYKQTPTGRMLEFGRKEVLREKRAAQTAVSQHQTLADELLFLGLYDEAAPELETALREKLSSKPLQTVASIVTGQSNQNTLADFPADTAYTLAVFYKRGEMANRAIAYVEPLWRNVPADFQIELIPREQAELLYPAPYADALLRHAPARNLDPRFVLSIMRQESRFQADVKSSAAARGLMQFISSTAAQMAGELGRRNFQQDELYNPPTAVLFGSQYLANLFRMFPNQPPAVAAGYNGGELNMQRWLARAKSDEPDRYVPEILFSQSKDYVYRVMANYRVYQQIYDEKLKPH